MGADMQVFAITHLPQVAAKGHAHYLVSKTNDHTTVRCLDREGRVQELARMLSGATVTAAAIANAQALLNY
jgi:DNA repair protein RecN (Recombination protein N)